MNLIVVSRYRSVDQPDVRYNCTISTIVLLQCLLTSPEFTNIRLTMDEAEATGSTHSESPTIVPDDEADEAASHIAGMSKRPKFPYQSSQRY